MTFPFLATLAQPVVRHAAAALLVVASSLALAAPGAHGPNGEHLDAPNTASASGGASPRLEARSEAFELVGRLAGGEFSMFINRFETNEPVLDAKVEVALGDLKAPAPFHSDQGDYAIADETLLKALGKAGDHALVITIVAGNDSDLLDGTLTISATEAERTHDHGIHVWLDHYLPLVIGLVVAVVLSWLFMRRRNRHAAQHQALVGGAQ